MPPLLSFTHLSQLDRIVLHTLCCPPSLAVMGAWIGFCILPHALLDLVPNFAMFPVQLYVYGSFHVKSTNAVHHTPLDFSEIFYAQTSCKFRNKSENLNSISQNLTKISLKLIGEKQMLENNTTHQVWIVISWPGNELEGWNFFMLSLSCALCKCIRIWVVCATYDF